MVRGMSLNHGHTYVARAGPEADGMLLSLWLATRFHHSDAAEWLARITRGELEQDGVAVSEDAPLRRGAVVSWHRPPWYEPDVPRDWQVLYEDIDLVAVHKPQGTPTMPAGGFLENTLLAMVRERFPEAAPMHRLGRDTSGIVIFARSETARVRLPEAFREHRLRKHYRALASGRCAWDSRVIDTPIGEVPHPLLGTIHAAAVDGKQSHSVATVVERREDATLLDVEITTGRPHQIRIHMAFAGHPLTGDPLYGAGGLPKDSALPGDGGYLLHAHRLTLMHPSTGRLLEIEAPPPSELSATTD